MDYLVGRIFWLSIWNKNFQYLTMQEVMILAKLGNVHSDEDMPRLQLGNMITTRSSPKPTPKPSPIPKGYAHIQLQHQLQSLGYVHPSLPQGQKNHLLCLISTYQTILQEFLMESKSKMKLLVVKN